MYTWRLARRLEKVRRGCYLARDEYVPTRVRNVLVTNDNAICKYLAYKNRPFITLVPKNSRAGRPDHGGLRASSTSFSVSHGGKPTSSESEKEASGTPVENKNPGVIGERRRNVCHTNSGTRNKQQQRVVRF